jgi:opacity protein-like surface antigen
MHRFRYAALAAVVAVVFGSGARAAPPDSNWTGFYVGGHIGDMRTGNKTTWTPLPSAPSFGALGTTGDDGGNGIEAGLHGGYNRQLGAAWVVGIEGDWSYSHTSGNAGVVPWLDVNGTVTVPKSFTNLSSTVTGLSSLRARLGYLVKPELLAYAAGGPAWANINYTASDSNGQAGALTYNTNAAVSSMRPGFALGGGLEWATGGKWRMRGEYMHYRFSSGPNVVAADTAGNFPGFPSGYAWGDTIVNVLQLGLSYKF